MPGNTRDGCEAGAVRGDAPSDRGSAASVEGRSSAVTPHAATVARQVATRARRDGKVVRIAWPFHSTGKAVAGLGGGWLNIVRRFAAVNAVRPSVNRARIAGVGCLLVGLTVVAAPACARVVTPSGAEAAPAPVAETEAEADSDAISPTALQDTVVVVARDTAAARDTVVAIPRDTIVPVPGDTIVRPSAGADRRTDNGSSHAADESADNGSGEGEGVPAGDIWVETTLADMTLRQKAGQLMMPMVLGGFAPVGSTEYRRIQRAIVRDGIGGLIVSSGSPTEVAAKLNTYQNMARVPLLVGADLETGAGFRFDGTVHVPGATYLGGATTFPSLMAIGATGEERYAYEAGRVTGLEALALGVHLPFAPVLDVNNNADNPIINVRSFGEDPEQVSALGRQFIRGLQGTGAIATGKHFPGHGNTEVDSHIDLPVIRLNPAQLDSIELKPFREAVEEGIGAIMTGHISLPEISEGPDVPSTLSRNVLTGLLRERLGFEGLIVTDAMDMFAIDRRFSRGEAAVRAVEAGADIILMPPDVTAAVDGVVDAVEGGRISEERLDASVRRILSAKKRVGLDERNGTDLRAVARTVGVPEHVTLSREIAERSITLLRNQGSLVPLRGTARARVLSVSYRRTSDLLAGSAFNRRLRSTYRQLRTETLFRDTNQAAYDDLAERAASMDLVIVSVYVTAIPQGDAPAVPEELSAFVEGLREDGVPHIVISFGNPYLLRDFPGTRAYMLAWSGADASQRAAARALFGEIEVRGRTPTRIPPYFEIGEGIQVPRKER